MGAIFANNKNNISYRLKPVLACLRAAQYEYLVLENLRRRHRSNDCKFLLYVKSMVA